MNVDVLTTEGMFDHQNVFNAGPDEHNNLVVFEDQDVVMVCYAAGYWLSVTYSEDD